MNWRADFENAPRDGKTKVDLWGTRNGKPKRFTDAVWKRPNWGSEEYGREDWQFPSKDVYGEFVITHWMPLPAPPSTEEPAPREPESDDAIRDRAAS